MAEKKTREVKEPVVQSREQTVTTGKESNLLTAEGKAKLLARLDSLKNQRQAIAERIKLARELGDISENAEYDDAKNEQAFVEGTILEIENMLRNARFVDEDDIDNNEVHIGNKVKLQDMQNNDEFEINIVDSASADAFENKISNTSPVGNAVIGRKKGETVNVLSPKGTIRYKILAISK